MSNKLTVYLLAVFLSFLVFGCQCNQNQEIDGGDDADTRKWHELLPDCPCENPDKDGVKTGDGWARDIADISHYHPGAAVCFRSYKSVKTSAGNSCQQCCYDENGNLITHGEGAGTPDKISTCAGELGNGGMIPNVIAVIEHNRVDVQPFETLGWEVYNHLWPPNNGNDCEENPPKTPDDK